MMNFITVALPTLLPIMIVLLNHFTSLHSFSRIFKMLWMRASTTDESSIGNQITVHLDALTAEELSENNLLVKSTHEKGSKEGSDHTAYLQ